MYVHDTSPRDSVREVMLGPPGMAMVLSGDGQWRFRHECKTWFDEEGEPHQLICAPLLHPAHEVLSLIPLTITPSVLCSDCNTHGFVRDGVWVSA